MQTTGVTFRPKLCMAKRCPPVGTMRCCQIQEKKPGPGRASSARSSNAPISIVREFSSSGNGRRPDGDCAWGERFSRFAGHPEFHRGATSSRVGSARRKGRWSVLSALARRRTPCRFFHLEGTSSSARNSSGGPTHVDRICTGSLFPFLPLAVTVQDRAIQWLSPSGCPIPETEAVVSFLGSRPRLADRQWP